MKELCKKQQCAVLTEYVQEIWGKKVGCWVRFDQRNGKDKLGFVGSQTFPTVPRKMFISAYKCQKMAAMHYRKLFNSLHSSTVMPKQTFKILGFGLSTKAANKQLIRF